MPPVQSFRGTGRNLRPQAWLKPVPSDAGLPVKLAPDVSLSLLPTGSRPGQRSSVAEGRPAADRLMGSARSAAPES